MAFANRCKPCMWTYRSYPNYLGPALGVAHSKQLGLCLLPYSTFCYEFVVNFWGSWHSKLLSKCMHALISHTPCSCILRLTSENCQYFSTYVIMNVIVHNFLILRRRNKIFRVFLKGGRYQNIVLCGLLKCLYCINLD